MSKIDLSKAKIGDKFRDRGGRLHELICILKGDYSFRYLLVNEQKDNVDDRFAKYYNKLGREKFIQILEQNNRTSHETVMRAMEDALNALKTLKRAKKKQDNQLQTQLEL